MGGALAFQLAHAMPDIFEQGGAILVSPCFRIPGLPAPWIQKMLKGVSKLVPLMPIAKHRHDILTSDEAKGLTLCDSIPPTLSVFQGVHHAAHEYCFLPPTFLSEPPQSAEWIQTKGRFYKIDGHVKARTAAQLVELARDCCSKFCEFRVPFITIHGTDDKITCHRASRELYYCSPQRFKRIKEFDGAMHVLQLESDEVVDVSILSRAFPPVFIPPPFQVYLLDVPVRLVPDFVHACVCVCLLLFLVCVCVLFFVYLCLCPCSFPVSVSVIFPLSVCLCLRLCL